jgi:hypothetical protein
MVFLNTMLTTADVNIHASNRQIWYRHPNKENTKVTAIYFLFHCDERDRFVAPPRHKFVTEATLLQLA